MNNIISYIAVQQKKECQGGDFMCTILKKIRLKTPYELLSEYDIPLVAPINISGLLENMGISTIAKDFSDIENVLSKKQGSILGAAFSNGNNLAIFYKKSDSLHRKKFTIAHELAHCCLDCPNDESSHIEFRLDPFTIITEDELVKEKKANIFAGQ